MSWMIVKVVTTRNGFRGSICACAGTANTALQALTLVHSAGPDVLLLDLGRSPVRGLEMVKQVKAAPHAPAVVAMTLFHTPEAAAAADGATSGAAVAVEGATNGAEAHPEPVPANGSAVPVEALSTNGASEAHEAAGNGTTEPTQTNGTAKPVAAEEKTAT